MRIQIDHDTCLGSGQCEYMHPELFRIGDNDLAEPLVDGDLTDEQLVGARDAAEMCPSQSISLHD